MSDLQRKDTEYYLGILGEIIERARERGEVATDIDSAHAALLFSAPVFYRYLIARQPIDGRWQLRHGLAAADLARLSVERFTSHLSFRSHLKY